MDIGNRLRDLRRAKGLNQSDVQDRSGLSRPHISLVENGHVSPTLQVLERWANALDVELSQLFVLPDGQLEVPEIPERNPGGDQERNLWALFGRLSVEDRELLVSVARDLAKRKGKRG